MITRKSLLILSSSALASGVAHGAVDYTFFNQTIVAGGNESLTFDLNGDGSPDFLIEFDANNALKPYINDSVGTSGSTTSFVLSDANDANGSEGLPLTTNGTSIDVNYESAQDAGYFYQNTSANVVGDWDSNGTNTEGYVGLALIDAADNTYYGWAQFIYNSQAVLNGVTGTLTLVDFAMETQPNVGILAGQTAESGVPSIITPPASQTNAVGLNAQLTVIGAGNPAPTYQWMTGAVGSGVYTNLSILGNSSNATYFLDQAENILTLTNLTLANQADYVVVLSNSYGAVTSAIPATLTVAPLLVSGLTPSPALLYTGGKASIAVDYESSVPVTSFQWQKNGGPLSDGGNVSGAASSNLVIRNLSMGNAGSYSVVVSNGYGAVASVVDLLTVFIPPSSYQQAVALLGPIAYYSFSETNNPASNTVIAFDYVGGYNGVYGNQVENGNSNYSIAGPTPADGFAGFASNNTAMLVGQTLHSASSWVSVPALNLNTNAVTFLEWVYPTEAEGDYDVMISYRSAVAGTANEFNYGPDAGLSFHWNDQQYSWDWDSGLVPPQSQWSLLALAVSSTNAIVYMINTDGMSTATNMNDNIVQAFNTPGTFGGDSVDGNFTGELDEIAIFNQTLSQSQLANLYNVAVTGILPPIPVTLSIQLSGENIILSWPQGTLIQAPSLAGPWTTNSAATSPYTTAATGGQMYYEVQ